MFLTVRFKKYDTAKFMSHLDMHAAVARTLKRAQISIAFSEGFNPHPVLKLSAPIPLGVNSDAEYFTVKLLPEYVDKGDVVDRFNACAPQGITAVNYVLTEKDPKHVGKTYSCEYSINFSIEQGDKINDFYKDVKNNNLEIPQTIKGVTDIKMSKEYIYDISIKKERLVLDTAAGNKNIRMDALINFINDRYGLGVTLSNVTKNDIKVLNKGNIERIDEYLSNI